MKALLILDAVLTAVGGVMMIAVGFVALVFGLFIDDSPITRSGLPGVLIITACFAVLFALAGAATFGVKRSRSWHWAVQAVLLVTLPLIWVVVTSQLRSA